MSRIDDLIAQHCPGGVEFKALGEVGQFFRGNGLQKKDFAEDGFPCIHYGQIYTFYGTSTKTTKSFVAPGLAARLRQAQNGDLVVTTTSENIEDVCTAVAWLGNSPIAIGGHSCVYRHTLNPMYAAYYFQTEQFELQKRKFVTGTKVKDIKVSDIGRIRIPVPPLEVQGEIADTLGRMESLRTEIIAELQAEMEYRSRQHAHYRGSILELEGSDRVKWTTLSAVCLNVSSGGTPSTSRADYYGGQIPWLRTQEVDNAVVQSTGMTITEAGLKASSAKWIPPNCVIVAMYGATAAKVAINGIAVTTNQACCNLQIDPDQANFRYVFHWIKSEYRRLKGLGEGSQSNLNAKKVKDFAIAVPSLEEQDRIVAILDKFEALASELSVGLPAEVHARRQQYKYYRERLLNFEERTA